MTKRKQALALSIIIPAYNEERHLEACLQSIASQSVMPDEVIVVDNNSTDQTVDIAKQFPFVKIVQESRQGVVFARNAGFDAASSGIIGRIDADSRLPANWVAYIKHFYGPGLNWDSALTGGAYFYNIRLSYFFGWWQGQIAFRMNRLLLGHYITYGSNSALPRTMWQEVRSFTCSTPDIHEDLDLGIHLNRLGFRVTYHEGFKVGVKMRRVRSERHELWNNLMWWPRTLRHHGIKTWVFGWLGALLIYVFSPIGPAMERIARAFGRTPIKD